MTNAIAILNGYSPEPESFVSHLLELPKELITLIFSRLSSKELKNIEKTCVDFYRITRISHSPLCSAYSRLGDVLEQPLVEMLKTAGKEIPRSHSPHFPSDFVPLYTLFIKRLAELKIDPLHSEFPLYVNALRQRIDALSQLPRSKRKALLRTLDEKILNDIVDAFGRQSLEKISPSSFKQKALEIGQLISSADPIDIQRQMRYAILDHHRESIHEKIKELEALEQSGELDEDAYPEITRSIRFYRELSVDIANMNHAYQFRVLQEIYSS